MAYFSILGDSISTFEGCNPKGYAVYFDREISQQNGLQNVNDTWWNQVIGYFGGELSVNNAFSGSRVSGVEFPAANGEERLAPLLEGPRPEYLLVYLGFNDFGGGVSAFSDGISFQGDVRCFEDAYDMMLKKLKTMLPGCTVFCATLMRTRLRYDPDWAFPERIYGRYAFEDYNEAIRRACAENRLTAVDLSATGVRYETLDGTHPTVTGHREIADAWIRSLS